MSTDIQKPKSKRGEVKQKIEKVLLQNCFDGLTVEEIVEEIKEKENSIRRVLERGSDQYRYEQSKDGLRRYFIRECYEILKALKIVLLKLDEEFSKTPIASNPSMNRIVTPRYLAERVLGELEQKNEELVKNVTIVLARLRGIKAKEVEQLAREVIVECLEDLIRENREKIERKLIHSCNLRVRIGEINYP